jgi:hypothetical protein
MFQNKIMSFWYTIFLQENSLLYCSNGLVNFFQVLVVKNWARISQPVSRRDTEWTAGVRFPTDTEIFSIPQRPEPLWNPPNLLSNGYQGLFTGGLSVRGVKLTTQLQLVPRSRMFEVYLHIPTYIHTVVNRFPVIMNLWSKRHLVCVTTLSAASTAWGLIIEPRWLLHDLKVNTTYTVWLKLIMTFHPNSRKSLIKFKLSTESLVLQDKQAIA